MSSPTESPPAGPPRLSAADYVRGVLAGDRAVLARAITLMESLSPRHEALAAEVLEGILPQSGGALRVGITGAPGVGKSTLINALGTRLTAAGWQVAVLAVDPSSTVTRGSILADKTRMPELARDRRAFIRPSPTAGTLGGVARKTREAMLLCEAAGFDVVLVETVGVGQSEVAVRSMVDLFLLLLLPGAGDQLQGIKKGVVELADLLAVTKADGDNLERAKRSRGEYAAALHLLAPPEGGWTVEALTCSAYTGDGLDELWQAVQRHREHAERSGALQRRRRLQALDWMRSLVAERLEQRFYQHPAVAALLPGVEQAVGLDQLPVSLAARRLLEAADSED